MAVQTSRHTCINIYQNITVQSNTRLLSFHNLLPSALPALQDASFRYKPRNTSVLSNQKDELLICKQTRSSPENMLIVTVVNNLTFLNIKIILNTLENWDCLGFFFCLLCFVVGFLFVGLVFCDRRTINFPSFSVSEVWAYLPHLQKCGKFSC